MAGQEKDPRIYGFICNKAVTNMWQLGGYYVMQWLIGKFW